VPSPAPPHVAEIPATLTAPAGAGAAGLARADLFAEMATTYAAALEYPVEVFTESVALEADLGIDSMKQTELFARAAERYGLPDPPPDFRLGDYDTMGKVVDYLFSHQNQAPPTAPTRAAETPTAVAVGA
jgi:acyl carrier protein